MIKGYKVVRQRSPRAPLMSSSHQLVGAIEYKPGEVTRPAQGNGPLAVFSNMDAAIEFIRKQVDKQYTYTDRSPYYLYECGYTPYTPCAEEGYALWQIVMFKIVGEEGNFLPHGALPAGTVRASEVILGLRVEPPDWMGNQPVWWKWCGDGSSQTDKTLD